MPLLETAKVKTESLLTPLLRGSSRAGERVRGCFQTYGVLRTGRGGEGGGWGADECAREGCGGEYDRHVGEYDDGREQR